MSAKLLCPVISSHYIFGNSLLVAVINTEWTSPVLPKAGLLQPPSVSFLSNYFVPHNRSPS